MDFIKITKKWYVNRTQIADVWLDKGTDNKWHFRVSYITPQRNTDSITIGDDEDHAVEFLNEVVDRLNGIDRQTIMED